MSVWRQNGHSFPYFDAVHINILPGEFARIFQVKKIGMIVKELQKREVIYLKDVFVDVDVVVA